MLGVAKWTTGLGTPSTEVAGMVTGSRLRRAQFNPPSLVAAMSNRQGGVSHDTPTGANPRLASRKSGVPTFVCVGWGRAVAVVLVAAA
jgi:hypothetical protein